MPESSSADLSVRLQRLEQVVNQKQRNGRWLRLSLLTVIVAVTLCTLCGMWPVSELVLRQLAIVDATGRVRMLLCADNDGIPFLRLEAGAVSAQLTASPTASAVLLLTNETSGYQAVLKPETLQLESGRNEYHETW